jgi:four helix bundle protein
VLVLLLVPVLATVVVLAPVLVIAISKQLDDRSADGVRMALDHEKLDVYRVAIEFIGWVNDRLEASVELARLPAAEHLDEASQSIANNIAEGNGKRSLADRCRFLDIARGSALECAACLDGLVAKKRLEPAQAAMGKQLIERIVSMLWKMIASHQSVPSSTRTSSSTSPSPRTSTGTSTKSRPESSNRGR